MPLYRFEIHSHLTTQAALERVRALAREAPGFGQALKESFGWRPERSPPFIGTVEGSEFRLRRDIRYRNAFLPHITGRVDSSPSGTTIHVTMKLHPFVLAFMILFLGGIGFGVVAALRYGQGDRLTLVPTLMFALGVAMTLGGFYPEAIKARRLLEQSFAPVAPGVRAER